MDPSQRDRAARATVVSTDATPEATPRALLRETEGAVFAEYVTLLTVVGLTAAAAFAALGLPLLRLYRYAQLMVALPFP